MPHIPPETIAIVAATFGEIESRHSAITLSMWHHLPPHGGNEALFADFAGGDPAQTMLSVFLAAIGARRYGGWPCMRAVTGFRGDQAPMLEQAFRLALSDVLGQDVNAMVVNAWGKMLASFLAQLDSTAQA